MLLRFSISILSSIIGRSNRSIRWKQKTTRVFVFHFCTFSIQMGSKILSKTKTRFYFWWFFSSRLALSNTVDKCRHPEKRRKSDGFPSLFTFRFFRHFSYMGGVCQKRKRVFVFRLNRPTVNIQCYQNLLRTKQEGPSNCWVIIVLRRKSHFFSFHGFRKACVSRRE